MAKTAKQQKAGQRSAAKSRAKAAEVNGEESGEGKQTVTQFPSKKIVNDLLKAAREKKESDVDSATDYAGKVKLAQSNHLNKDAFNVIKKIAGWTPEKQADFIEHFDYMLEVTGIEARAQSAPRFEGVGGPKDNPANKGGASEEEFQEDPPRAGFPAQTH